MVDLSHTRCITCGHETLICSEQPCQISCAKCNTKYDMYDGIPCLVKYQPDEVLSLVEILSIVGDSRAAPTAEGYKTWSKLLSEYDSSDNRDSYLENLPESFQRYLPHRHRQYQAMTDILGDIDLSGAKVLDIGAGEGFDTALLQAKGANVTALEFSPISASKGSKATPETQWFVGSGHALPFSDEAFDFVTCQATIHHMLHIPICIREMLRVLKPGGHLFTMSDSFRPNRHGEEYVCRRFNDDTAVLSGVNENIPTFGEIFESLDRFEDKLEVDFLTSIVYGYADPITKTRIDIKEPKWWTIDDVERLSDCAGGISCRIKKLERIVIDQRILSDEVIRVSELLSNISDKDVAMAQLATKLPMHCAQTKFPGRVGNTKFQLLNGWRSTEEHESGRMGYNRARWFLTRSQSQSNVQMELSGVSEGTNAVSIVVSGQKVKDISLRETPLTITSDIQHLPCNQPFAVEVRCQEKASKLQEGLFRVEQLYLT